MAQKSNTLDPWHILCGKHIQSMSVGILLTQLLDITFQAINWEIFHPKENEPRVYYEEMLNFARIQDNVENVELLTGRKCSAFHSNWLLWLFHYWRNIGLTHCWHQKRSRMLFFAMQIIFWIFLLLQMSQIWRFLVFAFMCLNIHSSE